MQVPDIDRTPLFALSITLTSLTALLFRSASALKERETRRTKVLLALGSMLLAILCSAIWLMLLWQIGLDQWTGTDGAQVIGLVLQFMLVGKLQEQALA